MIVRFSISFTLIWGASVCGACDCSDGCDVGHVEGWEVAALRVGDSDGVWVPEAGFDAGLEGAREGIV